MICARCGFAACTCPPTPCGCGAAKKIKDLERELKRTQDKLEKALARK